MQVCARDGCSSKFTPAKPNQVYCNVVCYRIVQAERKRARPHQVTCPCGRTFETTNPATKYCQGPEHDCAQRYRREYQRKREQGPGLFEQPLEFKTLSLKRLPDGFTFIVVGDLHIPFHDEPTLECVERFWNDLQPDLEIINGDAADFYTISPFDQNPSRAFCLQDELDVVRGWLEKRANKNPSAKRIFMEGNHEDRLRRWLWRHGPAMSSLRALEVEELLGLKDMGFQHLTYRSVADILGCRIEHGYRASKSAAFPMNVAHLMMRATNSSGLCQHTHRINVVHWTDARGSHSYRESGCLCRMNLEFAPFPNWQWGLSWGTVKNNKLHITTIPIYDDGFFANGEWYPRRG